ncbi:MAG: hypothetical protein AAB510_03275 [Patescibacteria group bacterium]
MDNDTIKIIQEKFYALPQTIQEEIMSPHYEEALASIGMKNELDQEGIDILGKETTLIMMGLAPLKNFESSLTQELKIDHLKASNIVEEIHREIFSSFKELLDIMNHAVSSDPSKKLEKDMNFILSGGDYASFLTPSDREEPTHPKNNQKIGGYVVENDSKIKDIKSKFLYNDKEE